MTRRYARYLKNTAQETDLLGDQKGQIAYPLTCRIVFLGNVNDAGQSNQHRTLPVMQMQQA